MFSLSLKQLKEIALPEKYTGRATGQVRDFIQKEVIPLLDELKKDIKITETKF